MALNDAASNATRDAAGALPEPDAKPLDVLTDVWQGQRAREDGASDADTLDVASGNAKICRNARHFTFDGFAEGSAEGSKDIAASWRKLLEREGKLSGDGSSLRDLLLGPNTGD